MLEINHVSKSYGKSKVLDQITLTLNEGIYALLGPNGAGKSTLMGILTRQLSMDEGSVTWQGKAISSLHETYFQQLGYAPQQQGLYDEFSGMRFLTYMALLKDLPRHQIKQEVQRVAHLVNLESQLQKKCKAYSGGMKQRLLVAQALLGNPKLLLFDEPTAGLDPKERVALRQIFAQLGQNHILFIATHVVSDVESIANEFIFLKSGNIIEHGDLPALLAAHPEAHSLEELYLSLFTKDEHLS